MVNKLKIGTTILLSFYLMRCGAFSTTNEKLETIRIPLDTKAVNRFSNRVTKNYPFYGVQSSKRENDFFRRANPETIIIINKGKQDDFLRMVIYTYDKKDSCIVYNGRVPIGTIEIQLSTLPIPSGFYYFHTKDTLESFFRSP